MNISSLYDKAQNAVLSEGVYDKNIFKALFMAGGFGSGKSFVMKHATGGLGFKVYASDAIFEKNLKDAQLKPDPETIRSAQGKELRRKAFATVNKMSGNWIAGRLPIIYDGSGQDLGKIAFQARALEKLGYETAMIFVSTSKETSIERDASRERTIGADIVGRCYDDIYGNLTAYKQYFGQDFIFVENNEFGRTDLLDKAAKEVRRFANRPVANVIAQTWVNTELEYRKLRGAS